MQSAEIAVDKPEEGFSVIAEITHCHTFAKEINHARVRSQYFNENFYCKNCL